MDINVNFLRRNVRSHGAPGHSTTTGGGALGWNLPVLTQTAGPAGEAWEPHYKTMFFLAHQRRNFFRVSPIVPPSYSILPMSDPQLAFHGSPMAIFAVLATGRVSSSYRSAEGTTNFPALPCSDDVSRLSASRFPILLFHPGQYLGENIPATPHTRVPRVVAQEGC